MANNSDLQELRDYVINTGLMLETILRGRKTTMPEKRKLLIERLLNMAIDINEMDKNDSQE